VRFLIIFKFKYFTIISNFSGVIQFNDLLRSSSESEIAEIEKLQPLISPDSACNIQFSSGTTGQPKAAMLSHFNIVNNGL
jgi:medium-chain acyl-CoA ligase, mitochondrial